MARIEAMNALNEFLSNPALSIIFAFLFLALGIICVVIIGVNGMRESDVRKAKAEVRAVISEAREYEKENRAKYRKLNAEKWALNYECKQLKREVARLNYRIEQLTKGAEYVSGNVKHE